MKETKPKVLMIGSYPPPYGGIGVYVRDLLNSPVKNHFNLLFLRTASRTSEEMPFIKKLAREIRDVFSLLYYLLKDRNIKIIHIHTSSYLGFWRYSIYVLIGKTFQKKVILHILGGGFKNFYKDCWSLQKWYIKYIFKLSDKIIALASIWKSFFSNLTEPNKISVVPIAVYCQDIDVNFDKEKFLKKIGLPKNGVKCTFLGGILKDKGVLDILEAIDDIISNQIDEDIYFVFAGKGELANNIENYCKRFKKSVIYLGYIDDNTKKKLFHSSDIFLLPSYIEGFPIALLEALAAGLAVITTPVGGIPEIIKDGENGFLIRPGDVEALKKRILMLASNKELRGKIGKRNRELVKEKYSWDVIAEKIMEVYNGVLKEK